MGNYTIRDLENFTGIKAHTIRIWEKRYNLIDPKRTSTNIRYYNDEDLKKLLNVSILNRSGVKISNIVNFSDETISERILNLSHSKSDIEAQVEGLILAMIDLDESKFEKIFNTAVINMGFEEAILKLMYPFFERIGILWQIGAINPAQEHFISNLLRQKLIVAIDGISNSVNGNAKSFLLFLPEGEHHELGLIYYHYIIRKHKHKVYYLGETLPLEGLKEISILKNIHYIVTSITTAIPLSEVQAYINTLSDYFKKSTIFLTGFMVRNINFPLPPNTFLIEDVNKLKEELDKIS
jgi:MerR family transcriptional regulator, light-induced transcriptional regulator